MLSLTLPHHTLHYIARGNPTNPPLLMLHGFLGSHQDFSMIVPELTQRFYCITPNLPGHGKTLTSTGYYTFPAAAQALIDLLNHLCISRTHLLGYSMGGRLALYLACYFPKHFSSVIIESASPGLKTDEERRLRVEKDEAIARKLETLPFPDFISQWYKNPLFDSLKSHPELYAKMLERRLNNRPSELANALRGMSTGRQPSLWNSLGQVACPLLLLVGEKDEKFVAIAHDMRSVFPQASEAALNIAKGYGHNIHLEASSYYAQCALNFIHRVRTYRTIE